MGDLEREMSRQAEENARHQERMAAWREEGKTNLENFIGMMQAHHIGQTILYACHSELVTPPPIKRRFRKPVEQKSVWEDTFSMIGRGWEFDIYCDGSPQLHIVLENTEAYSCRRPNIPTTSAPFRTLYGRPDPPHLEQPYVVSTRGPIDYRELWGETGLELLASSARKHIEAAQS